MTRLSRLTNVFRPNTFNYALIEYLAEKLRQNKIRCNKRVSHLMIKLPREIEGFNTLIVDCFNGKAYLRDTINKGKKDKKIFNINRFFGNRESDAMNCAEGACNQITKYLNKTFGDDLIDMRKEGNENKTAKRNIDLAAAVINGKVYHGDIIAKPINRFIKNLGIDDLSVKNRKQFEKELGKGIITQFASAYIMDDKLFINKDTLDNISLKEASVLLKEEYPNYEIYSTTSKKKLANKVEVNNKNIIDVKKEMNNIVDFRKAKKISRLKKKANHDISNRDCALAWIDGNIYEGLTHAACVHNYLKDFYNKGLNDKQMRPNVNIDADDAWDENQEEDLNNIYDNIKQMAFGHIDKQNKAIYLEQEGLNTEGIIATIANDVKQKYPDYNVYLDNPSNQNYEKLANKQYIFDLRLGM